MFKQLPGQYECFLFFSSLPHGVSCLLHHVCMVILANHLHQTNEPSQRGMNFFFHSNDSIVIYEPVCSGTGTKIIIIAKQEK